MYRYIGFEEGRGGFLGVLFRSYQRRNDIILISSYFDFNSDLEFRLNLNLSSHSSQSLMRGRC